MPLPRRLPVPQHKFALLFASGQTGMAESESASFVTNYWVRAPIFKPPAATPEHGWILPETISKEQSHSMGAALTSAHLRALVDGSKRAEIPTAGSGRHAAISAKTSRDGRWHPNSWSKVDFFAAQEVEAGRLFVGILASDWQQRLCKCRYPPCGRYFVGAKVRRSYRHGTFCSREHRAHASADALTKARRRQARFELVEASAQWLARLHPNSAWQDDHDLKASLAAALSEQVWRDPNLRGDRHFVRANWVTRNRIAIQERLLELSGRGSL